MGLQEIVNYVMQTPENTNSAVLKSVIKNNLAWEEIKNKPFGEEIITLTDTLTWDGNTDGLVCADDTFYKVSDIVLTASDVSNGVSLVSSINDIDSTIDIPAEGIQGAFIDGFAMFEAVAVVPYDGYQAFDFEFPEAGIYFLNYGGTTRVKSFTVNGYKGFKTEKTVVHPIEQKYLPESLQFRSEDKEDLILELEEKEVTGTYYDSTQFYTSWECNDFPDVIVGDFYTVEFLGDKYPAYSDSTGAISFTTEAGVYTVGVHSSSGYVAFYGPNKGATALPFTTSLNVYHAYEDVTTLDIKYLPEEVQPMKITAKSVQKSSDDKVMIQSPVYLGTDLPVNFYPQRLQECLECTLAPVYVYCSGKRVGEIFHYDTDTRIAYGVFFDYSTGTQYPKAYLYT